MTAGGLQEDLESCRMIWNYDLEFRFGITNWNYDLESRFGIVIWNHDLESEGFGISNQAKWKR